MVFLFSKKGLTTLVPQIFLFALFWTQALNSSRTTTAIIILSAALILLLRDFLLGIVSIIFGLAISVLIVEFDYLIKIFDGNNINRLYLLVFISIFISAFLIKLFINIEKVKSFKENLQYQLVISLYLVFSFYLFELINRQNKFNAMRFLVSTGEDNAAWLSGLSGGYVDDPNNFYLEQSSTYSGTTSAIISMVVRGITKFEIGSYQITDNILNLQRLFSICMTLGIFIVALSTYRFANNLRFSFLNSLSISLLSGLVTYLGFTTFALYGHLTPSESLIFLFASMSLLTYQERFKSVNSQFKAKLIFIVPLILFFAASKAWWPLAPAMYLAIGLILFKVIFGANSTQNRNKLIKYATIPALFILIWLNKKILNILLNSYQDFMEKLHIPGGTMSLGLVHILLIITTLIIAIAIKKYENLSENQNLIFKSLLFALFSYYFVTIFLSHITPPFTVSYAGFKLGLLLGVFVLPISILTIANFYYVKTKFKYSGLIFAMGAFLVFMNAGPPTSPNNPAWNQMGFPFGLISAIENDPEGGWIWVKPMLEALDQNPEKRVLCYQSNQSSIDPFQLGICTRFITSIQGFDKEPITSLWYEVINNSISSEQFEKIAPIDFLVGYKVVDLSPVGDPVQEVLPNGIRDFLIKNSLI